MIKKISLILLLCTGCNDFTITDFNGESIPCDYQFTENETVKNGVVECEYLQVNADYVTIENVTFHTKYIGLNGGFRGLVVRNSLFENISGTDQDSAYAVGINNPGKDCEIYDNTFKNIYRQPHRNGVGEGVGVLVSKGSSCVIRNNRFINDVFEDHSYGIWVAGGAYADIYSNYIEGFEYPIARVK